MRVINFDKGSKRRLRQIRWKQHEIISAILLFLILATLALWFALYQPAHEHHTNPLQPRQFIEANSSGAMLLLGTPGHDPGSSIPSNGPRQ